MDLKSYIEEIESKKLNVEGIIVYQRGRELAQHRWIPEARRVIWSVSKSFVSIAAGIAIDEGKLKLSDRLTKFFPRKKADLRWDSLNLEHLLTMTMGLGEIITPQNLKKSLSYELSRDPGSYFLYDNNCTFLISAMLTKATGLKLRDYLIDRLFHPLGIPDPNWPESKDGYTIGWTGLELTTSELSLFGRFLLSKGKWEGKQLVSASWIEAATRTQVSTRPSEDVSDKDVGYGYQFWTCRFGAYRCDGRDGQFIVVFPALDAVISINSSQENPKHILWAIWDHILPQLKG